MCGFLQGGREVDHEGMVAVGGLHGTGSLHLGLELLAKLLIGKGCFRQREGATNKGRTDSWRTVSLCGCVLLGGMDLVGWKKWGRTAGNEWGGWEFGAVTPQRRPSERLWSWLVSGPQLLTHLSPALVAASCHFSRELPVCILDTLVQPRHPAGLLST